MLLGQIPGVGGGENLRWHKMNGHHSPFLTATWRDLVLLTFEVDPEPLLDFLPPGVALDPWQGKHLLTLVGLHLRDIRVQGVPVPFHRSYPQVNLRFYVRRRCDNQWRRGVVFVKQIVPGKLVALVARWRYQEKVAASPVRHNATASGAGASRRVCYRWRGPAAWNSVSVSAAGAPEHSRPGSLEEFVAERYYGYNARRDGSTLEYRIEHPRWRIQRASDPELVCDVAGVFGLGFVDSLGRPPLSALVAEGSAVVVHRAVRV